MRKQYELAIKNLQAELDSHRPLLIFTCGGTSGHINPALSVAEYIKENYPEYQIVFVGTEKGLEAKLVRQAKYPFFGLEALPFKRSFKGLLNASLALLKSNLLARKLLRALKPQAVFGTGGYVSAPLISAAKALHIPAALHEQNAFPGKSNLFLAKNIDLVCYSFPGTENRFSNAKQCLLTGNPVPARFFVHRQMESRQELKIASAEKCVLVVGGSLGAKRLNDAVFALAKQYKAEQKKLPWRIILALGAKGWDNYQAEVKEYGELIDCRDYIYEMEKYYQAADLVICRAGALTLAEIAAASKVAVFVPYPYAANDHQTYNAKAFVKAGAAYICKDNEVTADYLQITLTELLSDPAKLKTMSLAASKLAYPEATAKIVKALLALTKH